MLFKSREEFVISKTMCTNIDLSKVKKGELYSVIGSKKLIPRFLSQLLLDPI